MVSSRRQDQAQPRASLAAARARIKPGRAANLADALRRAAAHRARIHPAAELLPALSSLRGPHALPGTVASRGTSPAPSSTPSMTTLRRQPHSRPSTFLNVNRRGVFTARKMSGLDRLWAAHPISLKAPVEPWASKNPTAIPFQALGTVQPDPETKNFRPRGGSPRVLMGA